MLKSLRESIRSFWSTSTDGLDKAQTGSKRKHECNEENDPDVQIIKVEKRRKLDDHSSTFTGLFKHSVTKMTDWMRPKQSTYAEAFRTKPNTNTNHRGNFAPSVQENGSHSNVYHRPAPRINGEGNETHREDAYRKGPRLNENCQSGASFLHRKGPMNATFTRRPSESSSIFGNKRSTANESVRLKEKEEFSRLLQMQSHPSPWQAKIPALAPVRPRTSSTSSETSKDSFWPPCVPPESASGRLSSSKVSELLKTSGPGIPNLLNKQRHRASLLMPPPSVSSILGPPSRVYAKTETPLAGLPRRFPAAASSSPSSSPRALMQRRTVSGRRDLNARGGLETKDAPIVVADTVNGDGDCRGAESLRLPETIVIDDCEDGDSAESRVKAPQQQQADVDRFTLETRLSQSCAERCRAHVREKERLRREIEIEEMNAKAFEDKRRIQNSNLERQMKYQMKIFDDLPGVADDPYVSSSEEEEEETLPELTDEMMEVVKRALRPGNPNEVLSDAFRLQITRRDMSTLGGLNWLNDEVINFYMNMLMERGEQEGRAKVYAFNTFFYPKIMSGGHQAVRRWTKKVDIFSVHFIIIPVHLGVHWCLCMVDMKDKKITYYDSMGATNDKCLHAVLNYINDESVAKKQTSINKSEWTLINEDDNPQQMNGSDCGMFMCKYAEYISRQKEVTFTQEDMPYFRQRMIYEIVSKKLLQ